MGRALYFRTSGKGVRANGKRHNIANDKGMAMEQLRQAIAMLLSRRFSAKRSGFRYTCIAPAVIPGIEVEIAKNAK